jgi:hypothetical protein
MTRQLSKSCAIPVSGCILFLLCLFSTDTVSGGDSNYEVLRTRAMFCNGTTPCVQEDHSGDDFTSSDYPHPSVDISPGNAPHTGAGFHPDVPCPTTYIFDAEIDLDLLKSQVSC